MVMAVSSTSSRSASDLGDQLGLDESTNSQKEEGYTVGKGLPHRVAVGDLPTSSHGAVGAISSSRGAMGRRGQEHEAGLAFEGAQGNRVKAPSITSMSG